MGGGRRLGRFALVDGPAVEAGTGGASLGLGAIFMRFGLAALIAAHEARSEEPNTSLTSQCRMIGPLPVLSSRKDRHNEITVGILA